MRGDLEEKKTGGGTLARKKKPGKAGADTS